MPVESGKLQLDKDAITELKRHLDYGSYRIELKDKKSGAFTQWRFNVGWRSHADEASSPDKAILTAQKEKILPGAPVKVSLQAPYDGEATLFIVSDQIHQLHKVQLKNKQAQLTLDSDADWGPGFYVLASIVTPRYAVERPIPPRVLWPRFMYPSI